MTPLNVGAPDRAERTYGRLASANFFGALGLTPARGRFFAPVFAVLGPLRLALAAVDIYAVVAYAVARRAGELGLRLALGATPRRLVRLVRQIVRETLGVAGRGAGAGWGLALLVQLHLARGRAPDAVVFLGVPALLLDVAAVASWRPARRAARADPLVALRLE
ncbi:hypothetical protein tb265_48490 [Gemmatimonadetes bacterium T265]|nr:hypothetical protein tb265_48490 [Gemmatimonadetes bacterium T265]